jgi:hypothetical protein
MMHFSIWRKRNLLELFMTLHADPSLLAEESQLYARKPDAKPPTSDFHETLQEATRNPVSGLISVPVPENWNFAWSVAFSSPSRRKTSAGQAEI